MRNDINTKIVSCIRCKRLREYCQSIGETKRAAFQHELYWAKPVPNFGSGPTSLLIVGLAPAAHGGNRTGRMFTGDNSGKWLYRTLYKFGFCNSEAYLRQDDQQKLIDCTITAAVHCAPPGNKPATEEITNCREFLVRTVMETKPKVLIALGKLAWDQAFIALNEIKPLKKSKFTHAASVTVPAFFAPGQDLLLIASYHPSQQNTFTGVLTQDMFDMVFGQARNFIRNLRDSSGPRSTKAAEIRYGKKSSSKSPHRSD